MPNWQAWADSLDNRQPIYRQIGDLFRNAFLTGEMPPGERIPSIRELAAAMRVNPNTVSRAYQLMEREGMIYSQRGLGYFMSEQAEAAAPLRQEEGRSLVEEFLQSMLGLLYTAEDIMALVQAALHEKARKEDEGHG